MLDCADVQTLRGKRSRAILALGLGCGLRRSELAHLTVEQLQRREEHWAVVDLIGKQRLTINIEAGGEVAPGLGLRHTDFWLKRSRCQSPSLGTLLLKLCLCLAIVHSCSEPKAALAAVETMSTLK